MADLPVGVTEAELSGLFKDASIRTLFDNSQSRFLTMIYM